MNWLFILQKIVCSICEQKQSLTIRPPTSTKEISNTDLYKLLRVKFPKAALYLSDMSYKLCSLADINYFLKQDRTNRYEYKNEIFDCDNFSYRLMGQFSIPEWSPLAFGICWTNLHALNIIVSEARGILFIEPQKDTVQEKLRAWQGSSIRLVII